MRSVKLLSKRHINEEIEAHRGELTSHGQKYICEILGFKLNLSDEKTELSTWYQRKLFGDRVEIRTLES